MILLESADGDELENFKIRLLRIFLQFKCMEYSSCLLSQMMIDRWLFEENHPIHVMTRRSPMMMNEEAGEISLAQLVQSTSKHSQLRDINVMRKQYISIGYFKYRTARWMEGLITKRPAGYKQIHINTIQVKKTTQFLKAFLAETSEGLNLSYSGKPKQWKNRITAQGLPIYEGPNALWSDSKNIFTVLDRTYKVLLTGMKKATIARIVSDRIDGAQELLQRYLGLDVVDSDSNNEDSDVDEKPFEGTGWYADDLVASEYDSDNIPAVYHEIHHLTHVRVTAEVSIVPPKKLRENGMLILAGTQELIFRLS